ncbi:uncharacterized protein LOC100116640 [Nasonia vitripennis]|uniref:CHK kinase-like domain-containing protein n=1 Tax=Nasonia vitripennis TaxID=7425 RepID=A0A7M7LLE5_NASVI|nr:uncharacterized protein LOC100116640 [Nasonia vitripennis]
MSGDTIFDITPNSSFNKQISQVSFSNFFDNVVTRKEVENLVKCAFSPDSDLVDYHLRPYSEEKIGFLGSHLCLVVTARRPSGCEKRSFFVKTIPRDDLSQAAYIQEKGVFKKEADFFKHVVPIMIDEFKGESWAPRCYLATDDTLVFEDMKLRGFANRGRSFDEATTMAAIACLARLHASSLLAEEKLNGKSLMELYPQILQETEFKRTTRSMVWYTVAIDLVITLAEELGYDSSNIRRASECVFELGLPSKTKRNVINHGDLWGSNMIFDSKDHCKLVDFQLIRYAPLAHDVMQLLYLSTSREFRQRHEQHMIDYYYAVLTECLTINSFKGDLPSFEEVMNGIEEQRLPAVVTACIFHPTVLMDGKTAGRIMNDSTTYEAYYFTRRKPFVDAIMAEDPEYEKWVRDDVRELAEITSRMDSVPKLT